MKPITLTRDERLNALIRNINARCKYRCEKKASALGMTYAELEAEGKRIGAKYVNPN